MLMTVQVKVTPAWAERRAGDWGREEVVWDCFRSGATRASAEWDREGGGRLVPNCCKTSPTTAQMENIVNIFSITSHITIFLKQLDIIWQTSRFMYWPSCNRRPRRPLTGISSSRMIGKASKASEKIWQSRNSKRETVFVQFRTPTEWQKVVWSIHVSHIIK